MKKIIGILFLLLLSAPVLGILPRDYCGRVNEIKTLDITKGESLQVMVNYNNCGNIGHRVIVSTEVYHYGKKVLNGNKNFWTEPYSYNELLSDYKQAKRLEIGAYLMKVEVYMIRDLDKVLLRKEYLKLRVYPIPFISSFSGGFGI